jgi:hypothetical protein
MQCNAMSCTGKQSGPSAGNSVRSKRGETIACSFSRCSQPAACNDDAEQRILPSGLADRAGRLWRGGRSDETREAGRAETGTETSMMAMKGRWVGGGLGR